MVATSKIHLISTDFFFSITLILKAIKHKGASFQSPRKFFLRQYGPPWCQWVGFNFSVNMLHIILETNLSSQSLALILTTYQNNQETRQKSTKWCWWCVCVVLRCRPTWTVQTRGSSVSKWAVFICQRVITLECLRWRAIFPVHLRVAVSDVLVPVDSVARCDVSWRLCEATSHDRQPTH